LDYLNLLHRIFAHQAVREGLLDLARQCDAIADAREGK
jgi:hypothetical protein